MSLLIEIEDLENKSAGLTTEAETASSPPISKLTDDDPARELARQSGDKPAPPSSTQVGGFNLSRVSGSTITTAEIPKLCLMSRKPQLTSAAKRNHNLEVTNLASNPRETAEMP